MIDNCIRILVRIIESKHTVRKKKAEKILAELESKNEIELSKLETFLLEIEKLYDKFDYAYNLVPEQTWVNYKIFGVKGLQEQILLENAIVAVNKKWKEIQ